MKDDTYIFTTQDPLGRTVTLRSHTWNVHVTGEHNFRTEFSGQEKLIENIIKNPYYILPDDHRDPSNTKEKYLDIAMLPSFERLKCCVVIVDYATGTGDVTTIIAKSSVSESTAGGVIYVRPQKT